MSAYHLATVAPVMRRVRIPISRDQGMLLMAAVNEIFLGLDTYLAHLTSGTIVPREWIPIIFGPAAGALLLLAGLIALRRRMVANLLGTLVFSASIVVGVLGSYYHWVRAILPNAPIGQQVSLPLIVWAPPMLAPIMFALIGILGMSAAWQEDEPDSGRLVLPGGGRLALPYSKTQAYFLAVGIGMLFTVLSSVFDHARAQFSNPWVWLPTVVGIFATIITLVIGFLDHPRRTDLTIYTLTMLLLILVGLIGFGLHITENLVQQGVIIQERFIRGAPVLAPMLFANMGTLGLIVLLDPKEKK